MSLPMKADPFGAAVLIEDPFCKLRGNSRDSAGLDFPAVASTIHAFLFLISSTSAARFRVAHKCERPIIDHNTSPFSLGPIPYNCR
jgi:hypothetical protein